MRPEQGGLPGLERQRHGWERTHWSAAASASCPPPLLVVCCFGIEVIVGVLGQLPLVAPVHEVRGAAGQVRTELHRCRSS